MKSEISDSYINRMKRNHPASPRGVRRAVVVGDNGRDNIGCAISDALWLGGFEKVRRIDKRNPGGDVKEMTGEDRLDLFSGSDTLVCANGYTNLDWIEDQSDDDVEQAISDSLTTSIVCARDFVRATIDDEWRKYIIFIGSMAYRNVLNGSSVYCAAKAGLNHFSRCIAWELAPKGYNVITINPSNTEGTPMTQSTIEGLMKYRGLTRGEAEAYWGACLPKHSWLQPNDIAKLALSFALGECDYLSGSAADLAGGQR